MGVALLSVTWQTHCSMKLLTANKPKMFKLKVVELFAGVAAPTPLDTPRLDETNVHWYE